MADTMTSAAQSILQHPVAPEDEARAGCYAILGRLFAEPPDRALLRALAEAPALGASVAAADGEHEAGARLGHAWDALRAASSVMDPDAARQEYADLFLGVGKSDVNLYASHWLAGFMMEWPLVELRAALAELGLARLPGSVLTEDHLSALCETMRVLVGGIDSTPPAELAVQRAFFDKHLAPWVCSCCTAITKLPVANYYRRVAEFTQCFMALERDSFAME